MKILLFADLHMCPRASIINKWGTKFPSRLENCIKSVNWLENLAKESNCDYIINLGDFFDRPDLSSETITAYKEIKWVNKKHYSLVGNHDASTSSLLFNSVNSLLNKNHSIVTQPEILSLSDCELCFLPYIVECDKKPLIEYFKEKPLDKPRIIFSHNDIMGIQLGPVVSKTGFTKEEIEANCDLFINGHLHNGQKISDKIINLGNLTGKDFGEDAFKYTHNVAILDTETLSLNFVENPHAFNFYKIQINQDADLHLLENLKPQAVVSIKCNNKVLEKTKQKLDLLSKQIIESRLIIIKDIEDISTEKDNIDLTVDHLAKFIDCCKTNIEYSKLLEEELAELCK